MFKSLCFCPSFHVLDLHVPIHIGHLAAVQYHTAETHFGCHIGGCEWLAAGDDKVKFVRSTGCEAGLVLIAVDDPFGGLANHCALFIQQETRGAGGFDVLAEIVFHRQCHNCFLAGHFRR